MDVDEDFLGENRSNWGSAALGDVLCDERRDDALAALATRSPLLFSVRPFKK